jgi:hypothetical protein
VKASVPRLAFVLSVMIAVAALVVLSRSTHASAQREAHRYLPLNCVTVGWHLLYHPPQKRTVCVPGM